MTDIDLFTLILFITVVVILGILDTMIRRRKNGE